MYESYLGMMHDDTEKPFVKFSIPYLTRKPFSLAYGSKIL